MTGGLGSTPVGAVLAGADLLTDLTARIPTGRWDGPGLGEWDLRSLVGHASRSMSTVVTYLDQPADAVEVDSPEEYYRWASASVAADPAAVAQRGRQAGLALGADPATAVAETRDRLRDRLGRVTGDPLLHTVAGGMLLSAYLPTRTFEMVVHSLDIARAAGLTLAVPPELLGEALALASRLAVRSGLGADVLLALTGRTGLPPGFTLL